MLLSIALPAPLACGGVVRVVRLLAQQGEMLGRHAGLLDFSVDLSAGVAHDCPPISHYRLLLREGGDLRRLLVTVGSPLVPGAVIGLLATDAGDPRDGPPARPARITVAGIVFHAESWEAPA